jgi:cobalamin synthase
MNQRRIEWALAALSIAGAIVSLLAGAWAIPFDQRPQILAAALMALSLWLVIGLHPDR